MKGKHTSPRERKSASNTSPASGSLLAGCGCPPCTSRAYGRPLWPSAGNQVLLLLPSASRKAQGVRGAAGALAAGDGAADVPA